MKLKRSVKKEKKKQSSYLDNKRTRNFKKKRKEKKRNGLKKGNNFKSLWQTARSISFLYFTLYTGISIVSSFFYLCVVWFPSISRARRTHIHATIATATAAYNTHAWITHTHTKKELHNRGACLRWAFTMVDVWI